MFTTPDRSKASPALCQRIPLSFAQETMLFWDKLVPGSAVYNVPIAFTITGKLNREALAHSIRSILSRHEVLRSRYFFDHGEPAVRVQPDGQADLRFIDFSTYPSSVKQAAIQSAAETECRRPFDLASDQLLRAALFRASDTEHVLVLTMHHIAADGWSVGVMLNELCQAYPAFAQESAPCLPSLRAQYADFAAWQRGLAHRQDWERSLLFWNQQLHGLSDTPELLPLDYSRPPKQTFDGATVRLALPASLLTALAHVGQKKRATAFMVMLAALQMLLHIYSGQDDLVIGVPNANRTRPEFEKLIGCFMNMVAVRTDLSGNPTFLELLGRVRENSLGAFLNSELPFSEVVRRFHPKRYATHTPIFQIQLVFQSYPMPEFQWPGMAIRRFEVDTATSKFDLTVIVEMKEQALEIAFEYNTSIFEFATMQQYLRQYANMLCLVVNAPETRLRDFSVSSAVHNSRTATV